MQPSALRGTPYVPVTGAGDPARLLLDHLAGVGEVPAGLPGWIYDRNGYDTRPELPAGA